MISFDLAYGNRLRIRRKKGLPFIHTYQSITGNTGRDICYLFYYTGTFANILYLLNRWQKYLLGVGIGYINICNAGFNKELGSST